MSLEGPGKWGQGPPMGKGPTRQVFLLTKFYGTFENIRENIGLARRSWNPGSATEQLKF